MPLEIVIVALSLAGFVHGLTGFGCGLVAMGLLPLWLDFKDASAIVALFNLFICGVALIAHRLHFVWRPAAALIVGTSLGVPIGVFVLARFDSSLLLRGLGALMISCVVAEVVFAIRGRGAMPRVLGFPLGMLSGALAGAFNIGGPPAVAFVFSQVWSKEQMSATLQVTFITQAVLRLVLLSATGVFRTDILWATAWSVLPAGAALVCGTLLLRRLPQAWLKMAVHTFLLVMGFKYLMFSPAA